MKISSFQQHFYRELFEKFKKSVEDFSFRLETYPFSFVYSFFSYDRIDKQTARGIVNEWVAKGWCQRVKYHGLKLKGDVRYAR